MQEKNLNFHNFVKKTKKQADTRLFFATYTNKSFKSLRKANSFARDYAKYALEYICIIWYNYYYFL